MKGIHKYGLEMTSPNDISDQDLKNCATQLTGIFHFIFQASLSLLKPPILQKTCTVVHVLKSSSC